ncbi:hypothetical protein [Bordetella sp. N]|uniref:hypothetical protein n=1 Tax=Bordetella sp. N TaxID=1746199 RepID=UPI00070E022F|nr:hypothetical protein [Bordetella sp. N]ALM83950.1 hypothetical protein ASB57_14085 [Bordetella sp. N]
MNAGEHRGWTLRVPVLTPRWVTLAAPAMRWVGAAAAACALVWMGLPASLATVLALAAVTIAASAAVMAPFRVSSVRAVMFTADHALYVRLPQGWRPLALRGVARGWRCLALQGDLPAPLGLQRGPFKGFPRQRRISFTVWQDALPASAWRRLNLLSQRSGRRTPAHVATGTVAP